MNWNLQATLPNPDTTHFDLRLICGPRYNAFVTDRREEPAAFFQRGVWKSLLKPTLDDGAEHWDGLE